MQRETLKSRRTARKGMEIEAKKKVNPDIIRANGFQISVAASDFQRKQVKWIGGSGGKGESTQLPPPIESKKGLEG